MRNHIIPALLLILVFISCKNSAEKKTSTGFIKAGNYHVFYERTGKGNAILLLHAGLLDHTMWEDQVKALSKQYEVITIDEPFHGKTKGVDTSTLAADVIKTVMDSLGLKKMSVAGLSMGASVVQDFMIAYPDRVNKAILISAGVNGYEDEHKGDTISNYWFEPFTKAMENRDTASAAREFTKAWAEGIYRKGDSLEAPVSVFTYNKSLENLRLHKMEGWPVMKYDPPAYKTITSVKIPVLIIDGDKDLPAITEMSAWMEKNIPGARRIVIKDVAHMLNMEKPDELNEIMLDFLQQK